MRKIVKQKRRGSFRVKRQRRLSGRADPLLGGRTLRVPIRGIDDSGQKDRRLTGGRPGVLPFSAFV